MPYQKPKTHGSLSLQHYFKKKSSASCNVLQPGVGIYFLSLCTKLFHHYNNHWLCARLQFETLQVTDSLHITPRIIYAIFSVLHLSTRAVLTCIKCIASGIGQASSAFAWRCAPLHCVDLSYGREGVSKLHYAWSSSFFFILFLLIWRCPLHFEFIEMEVCPGNLCFICVTIMSATSESTQRGKICAIITLVLCSFWKTGVCHLELSDK